MCVCYLLLFCAQLTMHGMLGCAGFKSPVAVVQEGLRGEFCFICAASYGAQVSDICEYSSMPSLRPCAHR